MVKRLKELKSVLKGYKVGEEWQQLVDQAIMQIENYEMLVRKLREDIDRQQD